MKNPKKYNIKVPTSSSNPFVATKGYKIRNSIHIGKLSKKLGVTSELIKHLNHDLTGNYIPYNKKGIEIYLPKKGSFNQKDLNQFLAKNKKIRKVRKISHTDIQNNQKHAVRKNESLYSIAKRYNTTPKELRALNNIKGSTIFVGQKLILPYESQIKVVSTYTVKKGDHLTKVAKMFNTSLTKIKGMNKLRRSTIWVGQKLNVPPHKVFFYTVSKGDFLGAIAEKMNISVAELKRYNNNASTIYPGQKIIYKLELI